jgi:Tfp pilus assembly protein PilE
MIYKKAAMFGLDARIALAIFGALSVISGAALYKVMDEVKAVQYNAFFEEIAKASEAYYLDNGSPLPQTVGSSLLYASELLEQSQEDFSTWEGPYINYLKKATDQYFTFPGSNYGTIMLRKISDWSGGTSCIVGSSDCAEWVKFHVRDNMEWGQDAFKKLDAKLDNNDGAMLGRVRYVVTDPLNHHIYYQGMARRSLY